MTKISDLTDGVTTLVTDRIAVARSPFASGDDRYVTPDYIKTYTLGTIQVTAENAIVLPGITSPTYAAGTLFYNSSSHSLEVYNDEADVTLQIGRENWIRVYNDSGVTISNGEVVYASGKEDVEDRLTIALAQADAVNTSRVVGLATHDIETATFGYVTQFGYVNDIDTSAFLDGEAIYLSADTAGALTNVSPEAPNASVFLGYVVDSNATTGNVFITTLGNTSGDMIASDATQIVQNARKGSAGTITKGQAVYMSGFNVGQSVIEIELADADSPTTMPAIGIANDTITNVATGQVVIVGRIANVNTSAYSVNDTLYVSDATAGDLTDTKPVAANSIQAVAKVARSNVSGGVLLVLGAGRTNDIPNFSAEGKYWVGGTGGVATEGDVSDFATKDLGPNAQTNTTYTLVIGDASQVVTMNNVAANTLTIPPNSSVAFAIGDCINVVQLGAGVTSITGGTGVTLNGVSTGTGAVNNQYQGVSLLKIATDTWVASGDIGTVA